MQAPLAGLDQPVDEPNNGEFALVYRILTKVTQQLSSAKDLSLSEVVDELVNDGLLREIGNERDELHQYAFVLIGWLSGLCQAL
jgi:hypothetical protein